MKKSELGLFSFKDFYLKRSRRLIPALLVTLIFSFISGCFILPPTHLKNMAESIFSSIFFYSNFYFIGNNGYFDLSSQFLPLLNMWSLSVEEQFYFVWPLVLVLFLSFGREFKINLILFFVFFSFSISIALSWMFQSSVSSFYFTPFRVYEFSIGIIAALIFRNKRIGLSSEVMFCLGLLAIIFSIIFYDDGMFYPSYLALLPAFGTFLIIMFGQARYAALLLNNPLCIYIGKISYSLYLVHWPIIVFFGYFNFVSYEYKKYFALAVSLMLAVIMHKFVENPFRFQKDSFVYRHFVKLSLFTVLLLSILSLDVVLNNGWEWRFSQDLIDKIQRNVDKGNLKSIEYSENYEAAIGDINLHSGRHILIVGDSHSRDIYNSMLHVSGVDDIFHHIYLDEKCFLKKDYEMKLAERLLGINSNFVKDTCGKRFDELEGFLNLTSVDVIIIAIGYAVNDVGECDRIPTMIKYYQDHTSKDVDMFLVGPNRMPFDPPVLHMTNKGRVTTNDLMYSFNRGKIFSGLAIASNIARDMGINFIDLMPVTCPEDEAKCYVVNDDGELLYFDDNHWTFLGEKFFGPKLYSRYLGFHVN